MSKTLMKNIFTSILYIVAHYFIDSKDAKNLFTKQYLFKQVNTIDIK